MANIGQICSREVVLATRETTAADAAKLMREHHVGSLVVVDRAKGQPLPVGIVTDRDMVVEITAVGLNPSAITVGDIMDPELLTTRETEGVLEALEIMRYKGVRRLPVVNAEGALVGIVTVDDMLELLADELNELAKVFGRERSRERATRK